MLYKIIFSLLLFIFSINTSYACSCYRGLMNDGNIYLFLSIEFYIFILGVLFLIYIYYRKKTKKRDITITIIFILLSFYIYWIKAWLSYSYKSYINESTINIINNVGYPRIIGCSCSYSADYTYYPELFPWFLVYFKAYWNIIFWFIILWVVLYRKKQTKY